MKYKHIYAAHELRMWIAQIVIPSATLGLAIMNNPQMKNAVVKTANSVKNKVKDTFNR